MDRYQQAVVQGLEAAGIDYLLYVPGSALSPIIEHFAAAPKPVSMPVAREEEGIGILGGLVLGGKRAVLLMQDNGLGNAQTALTTFAQAYHVPGLILSARRGGLGEFNSAMYHFTVHVPQLLAALNVKTFRLGQELSPVEWSRQIPLAYDHSEITHRPVVMLMELE